MDLKIVLEVTLEDWRRSGERERKEAIVAKVVRVGSFRIHAVEGRKMLH